MNSIVWEEYGLGYYDIKNNLTNNMSILGMYKRQISNQFSLNVGLGVRQNKCNFHYIITDPFDNEVIIEEVNRYYNRYNLVTHFGLSWAIDKFEISIGYEFPFELFSKTNIETYFGPYEIFINFETQNIAYYKVTERNIFTDDVFRLATPVLMCDYRLTDKISLNLTSLIKPYGNLFLYQLDIHGETGYMPEGDYQLNDSRINSQNLAFYFGIKYTFN
ncbi:MAG TPA: hypothetical protein VLA46_09725 [Saprospiraceae bacterium]|nr:hypothetical protein [Saprospiraceae bacterium]